MGYNSASATETASQCLRKWGWDKIAKVERKSNESAGEGTRVHGLLEAYLKGIPLPLSDEDPAIREAAAIANAGVQYLPPPLSPGLSVEGYFRFTSPRGNTWIGYRDFVWFRFGTPPLVGDHKTTSAIEYAKTEEQLRQDIQANLYAYHAMQETGQKSVELLWVYYQTRKNGTTRKPRRATPRRLTMVYDEVAPRFDKLDEFASHLNRVSANVKDVKELPYNPSHCDAFGGCPYKELCDLSIADRMSGIFSEERHMAQPVDLMALLGKKVDEVAPIAVEAAAAEPAINPPESTVSLHPSLDAPPVATDPPKAKRGRPAKTEPVAVGDVQRANAFTLLVDCTQENGAGVVPAETIYSEARERIAKMNGVADYRFLKYGEGQGVLRMTVQAMVEEGLLAGATYRVDTSAAEWSIVGSYLAAVANTVIRSTR